MTQWQTEYEDTKITFWKTQITVNMTILNIMGLYTVKRVISRRTSIFADGCFSMETVTVRQRNSSKGQGDGEAELNEIPLVTTPSALLLSVTKRILIQNSAAHPLGNDTLSLRI
jgi:hypothetical protein